MCSPPIFFILPSLSLSDIFSSSPAPVGSPRRLLAAPPPRAAIAIAMASSSSTYLALPCSRAPLAPLPRPLPSPHVARPALAGITRGARAGAPLFVSPAACRTGGRRRGWAQICRDSSLQGPPGADSPAREQEVKKKREAAAAAAAARIASGSGGGGGKLSDWTTSVLIFGIWAGLMYYIFQLAPNQTPVRDSVPSCFLNCISMLCCEIWIGIPLLLLVSDNNRL